MTSANIDKNEAFSYYSDPIYDHADYGIIIIDDNKNIIQHSKWLFEKSYLSLESILYKSIYEIYPDLINSTLVQAIESAIKACEVSDYKDLGAIKALAAAYAEDGQFDKAIGWQEKLLELADDEQKEFERERLEEE